MLFSCLLAGAVSFVCAAISRGAERLHVYAHFVYGEDADRLGVTAQFYK